MQLFRIIKEAEKSYALLAKIDQKFMNGKEVWDVVKNKLDSPMQAEDYAYSLCEVGDVVKEFVIGN